jgi:hypothetical protein
VACRIQFWEPETKGQHTHIDTPPVPWMRTVSPPFRGVYPESNALYAVTAAHLK